MPDSVRIDKWLWAARFYKTRALATEAVNGGHVQINGQRSKAARAIHVNDVLKIRKADHTYIITIDALSERRGAAVVAQLLYTEAPESIEARERSRLQRRLDVMANPRPTRRPDKRQRRQLRDWQHKP